MGLAENSNIVHMIDYGLVRKWAEKNKETGELEHIKKSKNSCLIGTA